MDSRGRKPPVPPRQNQGSTRQTQAVPPPYELLAHQQRALEKATVSPTSGAGGPLMHDDPRSSSQDSLGPELEEQDRRTLLLVYIHGFMGNETSFRSFPAHVHNLLTVLVGGSHAVHTKIYPRYRSRGSITIARDDFSRWLEPHEGDATDVVLLGHSMGGLLAAEVALMPSSQPSSSPLKHRILGTVNFDVPFLGMHPGVVKSGLASIFKSGEDADDKWEDQNQETSSSSELGPAGDASASIPSRMDTLWNKIDPNYNPHFANDVALPVRKGWRNAWHFVNKHSDDLVKSTKKLVASHMEFGGAMANYGELKTRYARVRALEEDDGRIRQTVVRGGVPPRVRFVNYYTASTGAQKRLLSPLRRLSPSPHRSRPSSRASASHTSLHSVKSVDTDRPGTSTSHSSVNLADAVKDGNHTGPSGNDSLRTESSKSEKLNVQPFMVENHNDLPELPPAPPALGDLSYIQDDTTRKLVKDEHARAVERYNEAVKKRKALYKAPVEVELSSQLRLSGEPERGKSESETTHSEREALRLERERQRIEDEGRRLRGETEPSKSASHSVESIPRIESRTPSMPSSTIASVSTYDSNMLTPQQSTQSTDTNATSDSAKVKKDRKFCNLPPKDKSGQLDPCWIRVFMENVDEVGAHCGLFFVDERYERLVGEVGEQVEKWLLECHYVRGSSATIPRPEKGA